MADKADTDTTIDLKAATVDPVEAAEQMAEAGEIEALPEPRDERHDSIDPAYGTLTDEAADLRRERGISRAGLQADDAAE